MIARTLVGAALGLVAACAVDPTKPPKIAWDHVACDECSMLVGDPTSAAALYTRDGTLKVFDDPGCLFRWVVANTPSTAAMWFTDGTRWYRETEVAFVLGAATPMGSGLHAVAAGTPGAMTVGEASGRVVAK